MDAVSWCLPGPPPVAEQSFLDPLVADFRPNGSRCRAKAQCEGPFRRAFEFEFDTSRFESSMPPAQRPEKTQLIWLRGRGPGIHSERDSARHSEHLFPTRSSAGVRAASAWPQALAPSCVLRSLRKRGSCAPALAVSELGFPGLSARLGFPPFRRARMPSDSATAVLCPHRSTRTSDVSGM
jgi:hypothetical protein